MGSVAEIPDAELVQRVVRSIASAKRTNRTRGVPLWSLVSDVFCLGSTYSAQLCRRFGRDPDATTPATHGEG